MVGFAEGVGPTARMVSQANGRVQRGECPHIDRNDSRCASRFSLGSIESMFQYCCGGYHGCPVFHRLNMEGAYEPESRVGRPARQFVTPSLEGAALLPAAG